MFSGRFSHLKVGVWRCNVGRPIMFKVNFVDFCHDSAKQASLMALAAPKVQCSKFNVQCSMFNVQCSMFNVQSSKFNVQCSMFNVQSSKFKD